MLAISGFFLSGLAYAHIAVLTELSHKRARISRLNNLCNILMSFFGRFRLITF